MNPLQNIQTIYANIIRWFTIPQSSASMDRRNFRNVQIDAVGVGLASTAAPFLPVLLTRLGASTFQVSMLTFMPALTGLLLAIPLGQFLQTRKNIIPWFSFARLAVVSSYALTGLIIFFLPKAASVIGILGIWALATIPQTILSIAFSVVMNYIAGPEGRYELMTHRWSVLGFTNAFTALLAGQFLDRLPFPINYQLVFIALSAGGLISYYFSSHINLKALEPVVSTERFSIKKWAKNYAHLIWGEKPFVSFVIKRFVFLTGSALAAPLLPIYFVNTLHASDFWIALINIAANTTVIIGYFFWMKQTRRRGSRMVLLATTFGASLYPIMVALSHQVWPVVLYAGIFGIFNAGLNLVFFDELMKRVPISYSATFIAAAQGLQYMSSIVAPLLATWLSSQIGFSPALMFSGAVSLTGFALFLIEMFGISRKAKSTEEIPLE